MDVNQLTAEEKAALVAGTDFMYTNPLSRAGVPSVRMADGPHGLRVQTEGGDNGVTGSEPATAFPTAACLASGWNPQNAEKMGEAIAEECLSYGVGILLGPAANVKRNPLCGRNFEYFSEDPLLSGKLAAAQIRGLQSRGVGACIKHFALNNSENFRFMGDSVCDERAMREIYLKSFEIAVKEGKPASVMCAYNRVNGTFCSENEFLLTDVLRKNWGFDGVVMTDWGAAKDRARGLRAGLDLEMPGDTPYCRKQILDGVKEGWLTADLDKAAEKVLRLAERFGNIKKKEADFEAHNRLAAEIAADCAVLLKNDGALPLNKGEEVLVVGELFQKPRYQGAGSSMITPTRVTSPRDAFTKRGETYFYVRGYDANSDEPNSKLIEEAVEKCEHYKTVLVFAGLPDLAESEGSDREHMQLPACQIALLNALVKTGKKIVVVLCGGSPVELPFADGVNAILNMYLSGQNLGTAAAELLYGDKTPCGKLAETWVKEYQDVPFGDKFGKTVQEVYRESVFVGYRYYLTSGVKVRYPFGYGLSYTTFAYSDMQVSETENGYRVSCEIANTGAFDGAEIVQLYVKSPEGVFKPERELRGFSKVYLKAGEQKRVEIEVPRGELCYWNAKEHRPVLEGGEYEFLLCRSCEQVELQQTVPIAGEETAVPYTERVNEFYAAAQFDHFTDELWEEMSGQKIPPLPPRKPITVESRFTDFKQTFMGRILFRAVLSLAEKQRKRAEKLPEGEEKENRLKGALFLKRVLESNCVRSMSMTAGSRMPYNFAEGMVHLANGKLLKGLCCFCKKIKVPPLPKDKKK